MCTSYRNCPFVRLPICHNPVSIQAQVRQSVQISHYDHDSIEPLFCSWRNFMPLSVKIVSEWGRQRVVPQQEVILRLLTRLVWERLHRGANLLLIVASTAGELSGGTTSMILNDLEIPKNRGFQWFLAIWGWMHIASLNCTEITLTNAVERVISWAQTFFT